MCRPIYLYIVIIRWVLHVNNPIKLNTAIHLLHQEDFVLHSLGVCVCVCVHACVQVVYSFMTYYFFPQLYSIAFLYIMCYAHDVIWAPEPPLSSAAAHTSECCHPSFPALSRYFSPKTPPSSICIYTAADWQSWQRSRRQVRLKLKFIKAAIHPRAETQRSARWPVNSALWSVPALLELSLGTHQNSRWVKTSDIIIIIWIVKYLCSIWGCFFSLILYFFSLHRCSWYLCYGLMRRKWLSTGLSRISRNFM